MAYGAGGGATGYLLGPANAGLSTMFVMMNKARLACALQAVGLSERALQQARLYAAERVQGRHQGSSAPIARHPDVRRRSEEHTSELQSLMRISYAVFCLKKK